MTAPETAQLDLSITVRETPEQAMRVVYQQCRLNRSFVEVMQNPALRRCIEIMAENRLRRMAR